MPLCEHDRVQVVDPRTAFEPDGLAAANPGASSRATARARCTVTETCAGAPHTMRWLHHSR